jgi:DNA-binding GntR family transcriptional regulator
MIETTPLNEQIAHELKEEILTGQLQPNQKISIVELARKWGVSTTPVRDAVRTLEAAGFLVVSPRKSITVSSLDKKTFQDVFTLRIALECCAVALAINKIPAELIDSSLKLLQVSVEKFKATGDYKHLEKVDNIVHQMVLDYCDNKRLVSMMDDLHDLINWARGIVIHHPKSYDEAAYEHIQILQYVKSREKDSAVQAMKTHLMNSFERSRHYWNNISE